MLKSKYTLTLLGAATLGLAACGGGDDNNNGGTTPTPTPTPTSAPTAGVCDESFVTCNGTTAVLDGTINKDFILESGFQWVLGGLVKVGNGNVVITSDAEAADVKAAGVTLTVPAGTSVLAEQDGILLVTRGSKLMAAGTASAPITFSSVDDGFDGTTEWGGLVIQGFAPQYGQGNNGICTGGSATFCNVEGEGGPSIARFGGDDPADNSGVLTWVRLAEGGIGVAANNEVNGLTLQGVGHGTTVEYIQVHGNQDDAVEWFGGTVNAKYLLLTNTNDDDIDFDEGYMGNIQYALIVKNQTLADPLGNDPRGIEANSSDDEYTPQTRATIANVTIVGGPQTADPNPLEPGMRLRGSVNVDIYNTAVIGWAGNCVRIDDSDTDGDDVADNFSVVNLTNVIGDCDGGFYRGSRVADTQAGSGAQTFTLSESFAINETVGQLGAATAIAATDNGSGFAFDATDYIGAVAPGTARADAWWNALALPGTVPASVR